MNYRKAICIMTFGHDYGSAFILNKGRCTRPGEPKLIQWTCWSCGHTKTSEIEPQGVS